MEFVNMHLGVQQSGNRDAPLEALLKAIESGDLPPGTRLRETELAVRLGISRTPVREALHRLHAMGLAEYGPQRGLQISHLKYDQLRQLFAVREGLEGMATRLAADHASQSEITVLRQMIEVDKGITDPKELSVRNKLLHQTIVRASHNAFMVDALENLRIHLCLLPSSTYLSEARIETAQKEHETIVEAIARGDGEAAEKAAREHIVSGYQIRLAWITNGEVKM